MKAEQLDDIFDSGADLLPHLDLSSVRRPNLEKGAKVSVPGVACLASHMFEKKRSRKVSAS